MMRRYMMFSIIDCKKCRKEIFVVSDDVEFCDDCNGYDQQKSEMLD